MGGVADVDVSMYMSRNDRNLQLLTSISETRLSFQTLRVRVERNFAFAWEDKCKRLPLRFEYIQQRHCSLKLRNRSDSENLGDFRERYYSARVGMRR